jgi:hypothetical protein
LQLTDSDEIRPHLGGTRLRYADFFAALGGAFDHGTWSFENVDLAVLTVPTLLSKSQADAAMRIVLEDYGHYATGRKPRQGEDALLILDEFSALASGVDSAINLAERVRDVGIQLIVAGQSVEGLGTDYQARRLLASCAGGVIVHQCPDPEPLLALAGTVRQVEQNWELDRYGPRGYGKVRMTQRARIDPDHVRAARPGEAWIIQAGRTIHLHVLPPPQPPPPAAAPAVVLPRGPRDTAPLPLGERDTAPLGRIAAAVALAARAAGRHARRLRQGRGRPPAQRRGRLPAPGRRLRPTWRPAPDRGRR